MRISVNRQTKFVACIFSVVVIWITLPKIGQAGEAAIDLDAYGIATPAMPEVLIETSAGKITREGFRQRIYQAMLNDPQAFNAAELFVRSTMIGMMARKLGFGVPRAQALQAGVERQAKDLGGKDKLRAALKAKGMSIGDLRRAVHEGLVFEAIIRQRNQIPNNQTISPKIAQNEMPKLVKEFKPVYHGLRKKVAVTIGGQNFTPDEVVDFCLAWSRDALLNYHLDAMIQILLIQAEAKKRGIALDHTPSEALVAKILAKQLRPAVLGEYFRGRIEEFQIVRARHIFCAFDRRPGHAYKPGKVTAEMRRAAKNRAEAILQKVGSGRRNFAKTARQESDCPTASNGGDLGYLVRHADMITSIPPRAWGLDLIRSDQGSRSPLNIAPDPAIQKAALALRYNRQISGLVETPTGYSIIKRIAAKTPRNVNKVLPYLRASRLRELRKKLMTKLLQNANIRRYWTPAGREDNQYP